MRKSIVIHVLAALIALAPFVGAQSAPSKTTTIILVRHAEKAAEPADDPPLTPAGAARAEAVVDLVKDAGVSAIVSTQFKRTRLTVAPVAAKLGVVPETIDGRLTAQATADTILSRHRGQTVLVAGHSNTLPGIIAALGAPRPAEICDAGYDNVFVVTVPPAGPSTVTRLHFGAPSPACAK